MSVSVRKATADDVVPAVDVFVTTLDDLRDRFSMTGQAIDKETWTRGYHHVLETGIFSVATDGDRVVGICNGVVRDGLWFLTGFWVYPEYQGQGLGSKLTDAVWSAATASGARTFCVWSSIDMRAMAQYLRLGMLPGYQILTYKLSCEDSNRIEKFKSALTGFAKGDYEINPLTSAVAADIDQVIRGTRRQIDHDYFLDSPKTTGWAVNFKNSAVGYFYIQDLALAPAAWINDQHGSALLSLAIDKVRDQSGEAIMMIPGCNHLALKAMLGGGGRLVSNSHFFTTQPFGTLEHYLPSGPLLY